MTGAVGEFLPTLTLERSKSARTRSLDRFSAEENPAGPSKDAGFFGSRFLLWSGWDNPRPDRRWRLCDCRFR